MIYFKQMFALIYNRGCDSFLSHMDIMLFPYDLLELSWSFCPKSTDHIWVGLLMDSDIFHASIYAYANTTQ